MKIAQEAFVEMCDALRDRDFVAVLYRYASSDTDFITKLNLLGHEGRADKRLCEALRNITCGVRKEPPAELRPLAKRIYTDPGSWSCFVTMVDGDYWHTYDLAIRITRDRPHQAHVDLDLVREIITVWSNSRHSGQLV